MYKPTLCTFLLCCLPLATLGNAQYNYGSKTTSAETVTMTASSPTGVHTVDVGEDGFVYTPDSLNVAPGGKVEFHFYPSNHSVVQASFNNPCNPASNSAFFSGFVPTSNGESSTVWTLTVNDTKPLWFYCGQIGHCNAGMVGVINPPTSGPETLDAFKKAAAMSTHDTVPAQVQGGVLSSEKEKSSGPSGTSGGGMGGMPSDTSSSSPNEGQLLTTDLGVVSFFTFVVAMFMM